MSIKYKLSLGIALLVLVVISIFYVVWKFNDNQYEYDRLYNTALGISEKVYNTSIINGDIQVEEAIKLIEIIKVSNPFLLDMYIIDANSGVPIIQPWNVDNLGIVANESIQTKTSFDLKEITKNGESYLVSEYKATHENQKYTIKLIFDHNKVYKSIASHRLFIAEVLYLVFFACIISFLFVSRLLSPLKDILWKVNEVSSVRFHKSIPITTRDEFGLLAFKINSMSQNLSIYMKKLKAAFDEKNRMRQQLESFIDHSTDAIYLLDRDGYVIQINLAFQQLYGYKPQEVIGKQHVTVPLEYQKEKEELINRLKNGEVCKPIESYRMTKSGEKIPVSITITPIKDNHNNITGFAVVSRDMRHRHQMEELIRRSEKLNTVGQLAAGVAHEIRNPLTTLRGFLQLQLRTKRFNEEHIQVMLTELDRINLIVSEFLILSKPQAVRFKKRDIRDIMSDVLLFMNSEANLHNVIFKTDYTNFLCEVECEENQLKQVFINLIKNAMEAMPNGGQIIIKIECSEQQVICYIKDEGIGIDAETLSRIGDPFFTAKENGTGLGMMVSQKIISSHNGTLNIQSQVNVGTTVTVSLPLYSSPSLAQAISL